MTYYSEEELREQIKQAHSQSFSNLYATYSKDIYQYIRLTIGNHESAEDLTHDVFMKAYKHLSSYQSELASLRTWLHRIAYHLCIDYQRKEKRRNWIFKWFYRSNLDQSYLPHHKFEDHLTIHYYLTKLTEDHRNILILAYFQECSGNEISNILSIPIGTVKSRLHYALKKLEHWIKEDEKHEQTSRKG